MYSYSRVSTFKQCPLRFKFQYIDRVKVNRFENEDDPLLLGSCMDKGLEHGFEFAEQYYNTVFPYHTQKKEFELAKLKYWIERIRPHLAGGEFQIELETDTVHGFADFYKDKTLVDFKYANPKNVEVYMESAQLHIYKSIMSKRGYNIDKMLYLLIPKVYIRQRNGETLKMYYNRLMETLESLDPIEIYVDYDKKKVDSFYKTIDTIERATEFPAIHSPLCNYCDYKHQCKTINSANAL